MKQNDLKNIVETFEKSLGTIDTKILNVQSDLIRMIFTKSTNKFWIIKQILESVVLSSDEIIKLLRIIFKKIKD